MAILLAVSFLIAPLYATELAEPLGDLKTLSGWSGLEPGATLNVPSEATFAYPDGPRGQYKHGFRVLNDSAAEWQNFYGVQFEVNLPDAREVELTATIKRAQRGNSPETPVSGSVRVSGAGWHTITLPWSAFDFDQAGFAFLKYVKQFKIAARFADGKSGGKIQLRNVRVVQAPAVALECGVRGKATVRGGSVEYDVRVGNCSEVPQSVVLSFVRYGWEEMVFTIEPTSFQLARGEVDCENIRPRPARRSRRTGVAGHRQRRRGYGEQVKVHHNQRSAASVHPAHGDALAGSSGQGGEI
jgi:hypothetical protein